MSKQAVRAALLRGKVQEMPAEQVVYHIGMDRLQALRAKDPHPLFVGLDVGYEGESNGTVEIADTPGQENRRKLWTEEAVRQMAMGLNEAGVPLYQEHAKPGVTRAPVGQVLSGFPQGEKGLLHAYAIGYLLPGQVRELVRSGEYDTCSVEADVAFQVTQGETWVVSHVEEVTGVALANSKFQQPGFRGASVVAMIQELEQSQEEKAVKPEEVNAALKGMTADQVRTALAGVSVLPSQVFTQDQLQQDPGVKQLTQTLEGNLQATRNQLATAEQERNTLKAEAGKGRAVTVITQKVAALQGLTDKERTHVQSALNTQDFSAAADVDKAVGEAVSREVQRLSELRQLYGQKAIVTGAPAEKEDAKPSPASPKGEVVNPEEDAFLAANRATKNGELVEA